MIPAMETLEARPRSYTETLTTNPTKLVKGEKLYSVEKRQPQPDDIVIVSPRRSAIGKYNGSLSGMKAPELGASVLRGVFESTGVPGIDKEVDTIITGSVFPNGWGQNIARQVGLKAGMRESSTAETVNMACGSGLEAVIMAAERLRNREYNGVELAVAGGVDIMSAVPYYLKRNVGSGLGDQTLVDGLLEGLTDAFDGQHMGITAETVADKFDITRSDLDHYAARSQVLGGVAMQRGYFMNTIVPVEVRLGKKTELFATDESIRGDTTEEGLAKLKPAFKKDGIVTPGNASGISDGSAHMMVSTRERAEELGLNPSMRLVSYGKSGVAPEVMGLGPIEAMEQALAFGGLDMADMDLVELNEAFAVVPLACGEKTGITDEQLNPNGGAIAHGHPVGATGAMLVAKSESYFEHNPDSRYAMVSLCIGGGQGIAAIFENIN